MKNRNIPSGVIPQGSRELANFVLDHYPYEYIAITDHSKAVRIAHGIDEKAFKKQIREISEVNKKLGRDFVKS